MGLTVWFWVAWGVMFLGGEGYALFNKAPGDTLSETVWYWLLGYTWAGRAPKDGNGVRVYGPKPSAGHWTFRSFFVGAFLLWLFFHLTFGWFK